MHTAGDWFDAQASVSPRNGQSLQERIDCARPGDTIRVSGGYFTEGFTVPKGVNVELDGCVFEPREQAPSFWEAKGVAVPPHVKQYFDRALLSTPNPSLAEIGGSCRFLVSDNMCEGRDSGYDCLILGKDSVGKVKMPQGSDETIIFRRYPSLPGAPPIGKTWVDKNTGITYVYRGAYNNEPSWLPVDEYYGGAPR